MADKTFFAGGIDWDDSEELVTADGTNTTITAAFKNNIVFVGSGVLQWAVLDTATTFKKFRQFKFLNASSEICGVRNSDSTVWVRLGPHESCVCTLVDNSTAAGVWHVTINRISDPKFGVYAIDDFLCGAAASLGGFGWRSQVSGAAAVHSASGKVLGKPIGGIYLTSGTTATGYENLSVLPTLYFSRGPVRLEFRTRVEYLPTVADDYVLSVGAKESVASDSGEALYFRIDRALGNLNWHLRAMDDGIFTDLDLGVGAVDAAADAMQILNVECSSDATRADAFIDKVHMGTVTTNIPTPAIDTSTVALEILNTAYTSVLQYLRFDYALIGSYLLDSEMR